MQKIVKAFGKGAHILLPKELIGTTVTIIIDSKADSYVTEEQAKQIARSEIAKFDFGNEIDAKFQEYKLKGLIR